MSDQIWTKSGRSFSCGPLDVPVSVDKLRRDLTEVREALGAARAKLAESTATELAAQLAQSPDKRVVAVLDGATPEYLRSVAARLLTGQPEAVVLLAGRAPEG